MFTCIPRTPDVAPDLFPAYRLTIDSARTRRERIASLLYSGTAAKFPNIRFIFSHGGGTVHSCSADSNVLRQREKIHG